MAVAGRSMKEDHYRRLERMYLGAPTNRYYGPSIAVSRGAAEIRIPVREDFFHAGGAVHGSVYFKALDDAAYFAANSMVGDVFVLTVSFHITLIRPVVAGEFVSRGRVVQYSPKLIIAEAVVTNSKGKEVGRGIGDFARSDRELMSVPGYA